MADKTRITSEHLGLRPLTPRSIVLSVLLGSTPPSLPVAALVEFTSLFDISPGACRTALSRMVANDELVSAAGVYGLGPRLLARRSQQQAGRSTVDPGWDRTWWFATVIADRRTTAERRAHRAAMVGARFGELRPDTWLRPANVPAPDGVPLLTRGPLVSGDEDELVRRLWDLDALEHTGRRLLAALDRHAADPSDDLESALPDTFVTLAAALRFLRTEPQLPRAIAPNDTANLVRERYAGVERTFQRDLATFLRSRGVQTRDPGRVVQ